MKNINRKKYWDNIYHSKSTESVSWFQKVPVVSLDFVRQFNIPVTGKIIDVGGGDSFLVDNLIEMGYQNITVLDISHTSLEKAKQRLGEKASKVKWIVADATDFIPDEQYDFWHDRAAFHFLTDENEIGNYINTVKQSIKPNGILVIGTFSEQGTQKCSGLEIKQYSEVSMADRLKKFFEKIKCISVDHATPFNTIQNFLFCSFRKISIFT